MAIIQLTKGLVALIDDEDYAKVSAYNWSAGGTKARPDCIYVRGRVNGKIVYLHHFVLGVRPCGMVCDHKDGDTLNNRKRNLRWCTSTQNNRNSKQKGTTSAYKGVSWQKARAGHARAGWRMQISCNSTQISKLFDNEITAAQAYDARARELFGEFACLNFPSKKRREKTCRRKAMKNE